MKSKKRKFLSLLLAVVLLLGVMPATAASAAETSAIDPDAFMLPGMEYRPGVRWWWPGNGASLEDLLAQVDYLAENGFGAVEITAHNASFLFDDASAGYIYNALDGYDKESIMGYDTPEYYLKLAAVVERCNELGIIVDLNMGSGYDASDDSVALEDSMSNMTLGRNDLTVTAADVGTPMTLTVPQPEAGPYYGATFDGYPLGEWSYELATFDAVIVARKTGTGTAMTSRNQTIKLDGDGNLTNAVDKTYAAQSAVDMKNAVLYHADEIAGGAFAFTPEAEGDYEIIALYSIPSGSIACFSYNREGYEADDPSYYRARMVDHLDGDAIQNYIDGWIGDSELNDIVTGEYSDSVRSAFNDSYAFLTDVYYNENVYAMGKDRDSNVIGYDFTRFFPSFYVPFTRMYGFHGGQMGSGIDGLSVSGSSRAWLTTTTDSLTAAEYTRVTYDYNQLVNEAFLNGMEAFSNALGGYGMVYRQQAYNPPIDTIKSAKYVDIPEAEGESENTLKRVTSGAHLYGKNLITNEVYTLGNTPFNTQPQKIKVGFDLQATSGITNFFYHGLDATYFGNPNSDADDNYFTEEGWRAWPTIGVEMADTNPIHTYFKSMNEYAARANYVMQAGKQSSDVAIYMPLFGSINSGVALNTLNANGYVWDAINDDMIQKELVWENGRLATPNGVSFEALIVDRQTLPVATMEALQALAAQGAPVIFYGDLPNAQPSYADGNYAALDEQIAAIANAMVSDGNAVNITSGDDLADELAAVVNPMISYESNANVRFNRRTLETGGELAYIRNTSSTSETTIKLEVDESLSNRYWLDQSDGKIYRANSLTVTLPANGAIILLCEPENVEMPRDAVSYGTPFVIDIIDALDVQEITDLTLEVTADNIGTNLPGAVQTKIYTDDVLGSWASTDFQNGELRYVSDFGTYKTTFEIDDLSQYNYKRLILNLGTVYSAATVRVNQEDGGHQLYYAPFEVDITDSLIEGTNTLEIEVQPLKHNRRVGLKLAYTSDKVANVRYMAYNSHVSGTSLTAAGLEGPVTLTTATATLDGPLTLYTDAYLVEAGDYANITTEFVETVNSNTAIINYYYDTDRFQFGDFHLADGVQEISREVTDYGAKIVVMIADYNTQTYGRLAIHAKPDAVLTTGYATVRAEVAYVLRDEAGGKAIETAVGAVSFTVLGEGDDDDSKLPKVKGDTNGDNIVDLIDLSNMIDWFGIDNSDSQWSKWYIFFDFNNNGNIDIYDISFVAQLIK